MPTYTITDPNTGKKIRLTGDSPPSEQELSEIFAKMGSESTSQAESGAISAGQATGEGSQAPVPPEIARIQAQLTPEALGRPLTEQEKALAFAAGPLESERLAAETNPVQAALIGAGRGFKTIGRGIGIAEPETQVEKQAIETLREQQPAGVVTGGEILGETAPFLIPGLGVAGVGGRAAQFAATTGLGALETGLIARGHGEDIGEQFTQAGIGGAVAGTLDLALPVIGRIGGKIIRKILGKAPEGAVVDATGKPSKEFAEALAESGQTFDDIVKQAQDELKNKALDPREAARKAFLESQGLDPTKAQVTRSASDFMAQQEAAKTSTAVREALEKQDAILTSRFNNKVLETGGNAANKSASVTDFIVDKATTLDQEISDLYRAAKDRLPGTKNINFQRLAKKLRELLPSDNRAGGNIKAIIGDMKAKHIFDKKGRLVGKVGVDTAEEIRKFMNQLYDEKNPFANGILRQLKETLDDDVFSAAGEDFFKQARGAKAAFEKELSRAKISKFDSRNANLVRDILENKVDPDQLTEKVVFSKRWRPEDLQQLKDYVSTSDVGKAAFDDMRAEVMQTITDRAFTGAGGQKEIQSLSRAQLERAIKSVGAKKLNILFDKNETKFLNDMLEVAKLREPVSGTAIGFGPSAQAISRIEKKLKEIPWLGTIVNIVDVEGRKVLKAVPTKIKKPLALPSGVQATIPPAAAVTASQFREDEK